MYDCISSLIPSIGVTLHLKQVVIAYLQIHDEGNSLQVWECGLGAWWRENIPSGAVVGGEERIGRLLSSVLGNEILPPLVVNNLYPKVC